MSAVHCRTHLAHLTTCELYLSCHAHAGPFFLTLVGPTDSFPDLTDPVKRQLVASAVHTALNLPSTYPLTNILVWVQSRQQSAPAATHRRRLLALPPGTQAYVLGYSLVQTAEVPSLQVLQDTIRQPASTEALAEHLQSFGFIDPQYNGLLLIGLTTAQSSDELMQELVSSSSGGSTSDTQLLSQLVPIGESTGI